MSLPYDCKIIIYKHLTWGNRKSIDGACKVLNAVSYSMSP